jgi:hypothetical protein
MPVNSPSWKLEGQAKKTEYLGRPCLWLDDGFASVQDLEFTDGVINLDLAGDGGRGFYDVLFRTQNDHDSGELVYLRPHKSGLDDAQQYTPVLNGAAVWQIYNGPGFTHAVDIPKREWFHVRLEVAGAQARLYVGNMREPSLVMDDLKSGIRKGGIAFTGNACFSNVEIRATPTVPFQRREPAMPQTAITHWSLSPSFDALQRDVEQPLSKTEAEALKWEEVTAAPPGFVVVNRYRRSPEVIPTFARDFSKRLDPQPGIKLVYARAMIMSDRDQIKKLNIGYSDEVVVFLNDTILYRGRSAQRFRDPGFLGIVNAENDALYLPLKKGRNELMLAVSELTGGWGFICRFDDINDIKWQ